MPYIHLKVGTAYMSALNGGEQESVCMPWAAHNETFRVFSQSGAAVTSGAPVSFLTADGLHYLCAEGGGNQFVNATRTAAGPWETFTLSTVDGAADITNGCRVSIRACDGHYLTPKKVAIFLGLSATSSAVGSSETFTVEMLPDSVKWPMHADGTRETHSGQWVQASATLTDAGRLDGELHVWTTNRMYGFHGACVVFVVDERNQILWKSGLHSLGVDGTWIPGLPSSRTDTWNESVPADALPKAASLHIACIENPTNMFMRDLDQAISLGKKVVEVAGVVGGIIALF